MDKLELYKLLLKSLLEGLKCTKVEKDALEVPDNMARAAFLGKAFQHLPKLKEIIEECGAEGIDVWKELAEAYVLEARLEANGDPDAPPKTHSD